MTNKLTLKEAYDILGYLAKSKTLQKDMDLYRDIMVEKMGLPLETKFLDISRIHKELEPREYLTHTNPCPATQYALLAYDVLEHFARHTNLFKDWLKYITDDCVALLPKGKCDIPFEEIYTVLKPTPDFFLYDGKPIFKPETKSVAPAQPEPEKEPARPKTEVKSVIPEAKLFEMLQAIDDEDKSIQTIGRIYQELILECPNPNPHDVQVLMDLAKRRFAPS